MRRRSGTATESARRRRPVLDQLVPAYPQVGEFWASGTEHAFQNMFKPSSFEIRALKSSGSVRILAFASKSLDRTRGRRGRWELYGGTELKH